MNHKLEAVFPQLRVYVPAVPTGRTLQQTIIGLSELDGDTLSYTAQVAAAAKDLVAHFSSQAVTAGELPALLAPMRHSLHALLANLNSDYRALLAHATDETNAESVRWLLPADSPAERQHGYIVCDRYFRFVRVRDLPAGEWLGSLAFVALALVDDLPHALLNWDEMIALLKGLSLYFAWIVSAAEYTLPTPPPPAAPTNWPQPWQSEAETVGRTVAIAYYRLLVGHHWWQHLTILARDCFERSAAAFAQGDDEAGTHWLGQATWLFRSTTACMWYASIFPLHTYQTELRPTMVETDAVDAQAQHLAYNLLKQAINQLKHTLDERNSLGNSPLSGQAHQAVKEFYEVFVQDMEQHILIASSKVGMDASLAQKVWQHTLPPNIRPKNAMDLLRDMATMRQREWQKLLNPKT